jgi:hypothetical protein
VGGCGSLKGLVDLRVSTGDTMAVASANLAVRGDLRVGEATGPDWPTEFVMVRVGMWGADILYV